MDEGARIAAAAQRERRYLTDHGVHTDGEKTRKRAHGGLWEQGTGFKTPTQTRPAARGR
jgi:hypothetical protein